MMKQFLAGFFVLFLLSGCSTLIPSLDPPKVTVESFRALPSEGNGAPRFEIKLRIANPNEMSFDIAGISYSVDVLGRELLSGVTNDIPVIEGYSEGVVTLEAGLQLLEILRLVAGLGREMTDTLEYRFAAKVDFRGLMPTQRVEETGTFSFN